MGLFGAAHEWWGRWRVQISPLRKICRTYPVMMKLGAVIPYTRYKLHFNTKFLILLLTFFLINIVVIWMTSAKLATLGFLNPNLREAFRGLF